MPKRLGSSHAALHSKPARKAYHRMFGIDDFHSHFRWHAVRRYIDFDADRTIEVGANSGVMTFALAERMAGEIVASEFDAELLAMARRIQEVQQYPNVTLGQADLRTLAVEEQTFDQALVIDVLEHIDDHETAVDQLAAALRPGGRLVVSVPTPRYPEVFGRAFHESIGHVRDGYWIADLHKLLEPAGFTIEAWHYYTGRLASWGCSLNYKKGMSPKARMVTLPLLRSVGMLGEGFVTERTAASVALLARRLD